VADCPYDGAVTPGQVAEVAQALWQMGCYEISLGDTIGHATPEKVDAMLAAVGDVVPVARLAGHFHDTGGRALANIEASLARGLRVFDGAAGGLGGCPFAPGAAGNVATEAVHDRLTALGFETGLDREVLGRAADMARAMRSGSAKS
jgi:hydroxymethylglutaryl-CoA lyase